MEIKSERAGKSREIDDGYLSFIPHPLPPDDLLLIGEISTLLSEADVSLGRLDSLSDLLPEPDLFVMMYVKKEAVWSSQIEGTQASLMDVLEFEAEALRPDAPRDVNEVVNYVKALHRGIDLINEGWDLNLDLIRELHRILMADSRGGDMDPGNFRTIQNWIGPHGCGIGDAIHVPPPPGEMMNCLKDLESFMTGTLPIPPLVKAALIHFQFETIHPFIDGNGRMGRLLISLSLLKDGHMRSPLLYISHYLRQMRSVYYEKLQKAREYGDFEDWLGFFFVGISQVAEEASARARKILKMSGDTKQRVLTELGKSGPKASMLVDDLLLHPVVGVNQISDLTGLSYQNANKLASRLESIGVLREVTGQKRNRVFEFSDYLDILND
ncbi:MAG: Fic family protein [Thermoplasmatota archaeon]